MGSDNTNNQTNVEEIESLDVGPSLSASDAASLEEKFAEIEHKRKKFYQLFLILIGIMVAGSIFYIIVFQYDIIVYLLVSGLIVFFILKILPECLENHFCHFDSKLVLAYQDNQAYQYRSKRIDTCKNACGQQ